MSLTRIQWTFHGKSGLATDRYVNTFYCSGTAPDPAACALIKDAVFDFYHDVRPVTGGSVSVGQYFPGDSLAASGNFSTKMYTMEDSEPRVPIYEFSGDMGVGGAAPLPTEVAVCLSYRANPVSGVPQARRKGRIYIGPLSVSAIEVVDANGYARPKDTLRQTLVAGAAQLSTDLAALGQIWAVHSPTSGPTSWAQITQARCDDAFDTQRRRGLDPTSSAWTAI